MIDSLSFTLNTGFVPGINDKESAPSTNSKRISTSSSLSAFPSPPVVTKSLTMDEDYFERRELRIVCTQKFPWEDFLPQASEISPGLYLSDIYTATSPLVLNRLGITHVVSVMRAPWYHYPPSMRHLCIPIDDTKSTNIMAYFDSTTAWIKRALESSPDAKVLLHCVWGMSRSASFAVAYLMGIRGMPLDGALALVKARRIIVNPNRGFLWQLSLYEQKIRNKAKS